jgi:hypothetical protein
VEINFKINPSIDGSEELKILLKEWSWIHD